MDVCHVGGGRNTAPSFGVQVPYYWNKHDNDETSRSNIVRRYGSGFQIDISSFYGLFRAGWLNDVVLDSYMCLLGQWYTSVAQPCGMENLYIIVVESWFSYYLCDLYNGLVTILEDQQMLVEDKVCVARLQIVGNLKTCIVKLVQRDSSRPDLRNCRGLMMTVNVEGVHWILIVINFVTWTVQIYNSLEKPKDSVVWALDPAPRLTKLLTVLPYALLSSDSECIDMAKLGRQWKLEFAECAKQDDDTSCGVYTLTFADCLLRNLPPVFQSKRQTYIRKRIAKDLLECGMTDEEYCMRKVARSLDFDAGEKTPTVKGISEVENTPTTATAEVEMVV